MPITSPGGLPVPQEGPVSPEESRLLTEDGGPRQARPIQLDERQFQRLSWALNAVQAALFKAWWLTELTYGGAWFSAPATWPTPEGLVVKVRRFVGAPVWSYLGNGLWRVTCDFEVRGSTLLPQAPVAPSGGPWLYFPTEGGPFGSLAPLHQGAGGGFQEITGAPEPFVPGTGVTDDDGSGNNINSVTDVLVPLYSENSVPTALQYTWEPADPEDTRVPIITDVIPDTFGQWVGVTHVVTFDYLEGIPSGVLTLYTNNDTGQEFVTIITFLPASFAYPPVSVFYGPLP